MGVLGCCWVWFASPVAADAKCGMRGSNRECENPGPKLKLGFQVV